MKKTIRITEGQLKEIIEEQTLKEGTWAVSKNTIPTMIHELKQFETKWWNLVGDDELYNGIDAAIKRLEELKSGKY